MSPTWSFRIARQFNFRYAFLRLFSISHFVAQLVFGRVNGKSIALLSAKTMDVVRAFGPEFDFPSNLPRTVNFHCGRCPCWRISPCLDSIALSYFGMCGTQERLQRALLWQLKPRE